MAAQIFQRFICFLPLDEVKDNAVVGGVRPVVFP